MRVDTPFGPGTVNEEMEDMVQVELDNLHRHGNGDYSLWIFSRSEVTVMTN